MGHRAGPHGRELADDESAIDAVVRGLIEAWNRRDTRAFADLFAPGADYVTGDGRRVHGRVAIGGLVSQARSGAAVQLVGVPRVECRRATAKARFGWAIAGRGAGARRGTIRCTLVRRSRRWVVERLRNEEVGSTFERRGR